MEGKIRLECKKCQYTQHEDIWKGCPECGNQDAIPKYLVDETDRKILDTNWLDISGYSSTTGFSTENSEALLTRAINVASRARDFVMDFFAGSGTTMYTAVKNNRRWIGVEMGQQFNDYIVPRLKKVCGTANSGSFKYVRLESYEDTLNNLELKRTKPQQMLISESSSFKESYMLSYMLDVESKESLLKISAFEDPFNYKLKIATDSAGETKPMVVDLVETFNYLIGLTVNHIDHVQGYRIIQGTNPKGEKSLVIWRNTKEKTNDDLEKFFRKQNYNPKDMEFAVIYVNGDNNLENIKREDETWKVRLIEEEFKRLMFDTDEI